MQGMNVAQTTAPNYRPEIDYRGLHLATQDATWAIERGVLADFWPAYERMHEAAGVGPMDWTRKLTANAFACSGNPATLTTGELIVSKLTRIVSGVARNIESADRVSAWTFADDAVRGARRLYLNGLKVSIAESAERMQKYAADQSSHGLQMAADYRAEIHRLSQLLAVELDVCGLAQQAVA